MREDDDLVAGVRFDRINFSDFGINVETIVELNLSLLALNHALGDCEWDAKWRIVGPFKYHRGPQVIILKDNFIELRIDCYRTEYWIGIPDDAGRRTSQLRGWPDIC